MTNHLSEIHSSKNSAAGRQPTDNIHNAISATEAQSVSPGGVDTSPGLIEVSLETDEPVHGGLFISPGGEFVSPGAQGGALVSPANAAKASAHIKTKLAATLLKVFIW